MIRGQKGGRGKEMRRRDLLKAGMAGAASIGLIGLTKKAFAQTPQFKFRLQSFLGPGMEGMGGNASPLCQER